MAEYVQTILKIIANPEHISPDFFIIWQGLRILFIIASLLLAGAFIYLSILNNYFNYRLKEDYIEFKKSKPFFNIKIDKDWEKIMRHANHDKESERKLAVIEADDTLNSVLSKLGYEGENLLEKLEGLNQEIVPNLEELKEVHKERRDLVYDPNKSLPKEEAQRIISVYEETFKNFQIF